MITSLLQFIFGFILLILLMPIFIIMAILDIIIGLVNDLFQ